MAKRRCPIRIWPHDAASRCTREMFHGGVHIAADGTHRQSTLPEAWDLAALAFADLVRPVTEPLDRVVRWLNGRLSQRL